MVEHSDSIPHTLGIEEAAALLAAIVSSSSDAILSKTLDGTITSWNTATERLFGYTASEMVGQSIRRLIPADRQSEEDTILARISAGEQVENYETLRVRKDGEQIEVSVTISPIRDSVGNVIGASKIVRDITDRKRGERAAALLAAIVASSSDGIVSKTLDGTVTSWNGAAEQLFGYPAQEMVGQSIRRIIPQDRQYEEDQILSRISAGETVDTFETVRLHKDRSLLDVSVTISPIRDEAGHVIGASKIVRDISESKQAQERIRMLLHEVNHRTKNMLALVQAIARQTAASSPNEFVTRFSERIQALSANQDLLIESDWRGTDIEALVRAQLAHFKDLIGERVNTHGPRVQLTSVATQCIGMAFHELATNASKYGALSNDKGKIDIDWQIDAEKLSINWVERDGPPVTDPEKRGFGSKVMTTMAEIGVGGNVDIDYAASGISWKLTCDADKALARPFRAA